jgi:predicted ester cyclase
MNPDLALTLRSGPQARGDSVAALSGAHDSTDGEADFRSVKGVTHPTTRRTFARKTLFAAACAVASRVAALPVNTEAFGTTRSRAWDNKAIVDRWFTEFWGKSWNPRIVDELCAPDVLLQYLLQTPHCGRADVKTFMTKFRQAFPDLRVAPVADFVTEGDYVVGRWVGSGTHTGPAYCDFLVGCLAAASGQQMRFMGTTVLRVQNGKIAEQIGLDDEVTASLQLGLTGAAW